MNSLALLVDIVSISSRFLLIGHFLFNNAAIVIADGLNFDALHGGGDE